MTKLDFLTIQTLLDILKTNHDKISGKGQQAIKNVLLISEFQDNPRHFLKGHSRTSQDIFHITFKDIFKFQDFSGFSTTMVILTKVVIIFNIIY